MTIAWAIIIVAVLFLLDKYRLLKKTVIIAAVGIGVVGVGYGGILGYAWAKGRWQDHQFAKANECFDPSTGKVHPIDPNGPYCLAGETLHTRGTPLPASPVDDFVPNPAYQPQAARDFRYTKYPNGYMADELCSATERYTLPADGPRFCHAFHWQPWLRELESKTAGKWSDKLSADSGVASPGNLVISWDSEQRVVFHGCQPHFCPDASAYFIVAPTSRVIDIVWQRGDDVTYLGPNATLLKNAHVYEWLEQIGP
jgi:hypothetical protein